MMIKTNNHHFFSIFKRFFVLLFLFVFSFHGWTQVIDSRILQQLAPKGVLNAAIYTGNFLLVTGKTADNTPEGVSPDMAKAIAEKLGVPLVLKPFSTQNEVVQAVASGDCGIVLVGSDPARAEKIDFVPAYVEIEATYFVPEGSKLKSISDVDQPGIRIAVFGASAFGLWMDRNIHHAELVKTDGLEASLQLFIDQKLDALAGLRPGLITDQKRYPKYKILDGHFMTVQQSIATRKGSPEAFEFIKNFVNEAKVSGFVEQLIVKHGVQGRLSVAP